MDFANKWIGGGVLRRGAVQEEIMFSICPELITSMVICDVMSDRECILISGAECFNTHQGYSKSLKFTGSEKRVEGDVTRVAIDATRFTGIIRKQYELPYLLRELNKAYVAFDHHYPKLNASVATGNWGCGAFGGSIQLKSLLQWIAASTCERPVTYYTFGDAKSDGIDTVSALLLAKEVTVAHLAMVLFDFCDQIEPTDRPETDLFVHIMDTFGD